MAELTWGTPLFFDLWAAGMAGGAYFAAFLLGLFGADKERRLLRLATYAGVPLVLIGVVLIIADLGEPLRAFNMYLGSRPQAWEVIPGSGAAALRVWPPHLTLSLVSPMSLGGWALVLFTVLGLLLIVLFLADSAKPWELQGAVGWGVDLLRALKPVTMFLASIGFLLAVLVMAYTGVVLAASSMDLWSSTFLLPALFLGSAVCTGIALLILLVRLAKTPGGDRMVGLLRRSLKVLIVLELAILAAFIIWLAAAGSASVLVSGPIGLIFWVGAVLLGLVVPLIMELGVIKRGTDARGPLFLVSPLLVLLGGLVLRAVVVVAGQL